MELNNKLSECREEIIYAIKQRIIEITATSDTPVNLGGFLVMEKSDSNKKKDMIYIYNLYINEDGFLCCDYSNGSTLSDDTFIFERTLEYIYLEDLTRILSELYKKKWMSSAVAVEEKQEEKRSLLKTFLSGKRMLRGA